ncbi:hypothetical protein HanXRQr2_Chr13g0617791 [Helianthus annuus]|uniref:Uncharacterized protein n=1 Tax=Helianthus annuus TaxID=4232 RepID=A0A251SXI1_HELAN|nr:hypothetical protein HanXRQr2_Chr13g0617791 [Helianthus annuus]
MMDKIISVEERRYSANQQRTHPKYFIIGGKEAGYIYCHNLVHLHALQTSRDSR